MLGVPGADGRVFRVGERNGDLRCRVARIVQFDRLNVLDPVHRIHGAKTTQVLIVVATLTHPKPKTGQ